MLERNLYTLTRPSESMLKRNVRRRRDYNRFRLSDFQMLQQHVASLDSYVLLV